MPKIIHHDSTFIIVEQSDRLATLFEIFMNDDKEPYLQKRFNYDPSQYDYLSKGGNNFVFINKDKNTVFKVPTYEGITLSQKKTNSETIVDKWNQIYTDKLGKAASVINNDFFISSSNQAELKKSDIIDFIDHQTDQPFRGAVKYSLGHGQEINQNEIAGSVASFPYLEDSDYSKLFMEHFNLSQKQYKALESRLLISYEEISKVDKENDQELSLSKNVLMTNFKNYNVDNIQAFELSVNRAIKAECLRIYTETG